jgi:uncharacterized membrane protein YfcA
MPDLPTSTWLLALLGAFSLGVSKTGFPGLALINVIIMAELFGAKASVGMVLPLLIACDLIVYPLFRKHASWQQVCPLVPPAICGVLIGWLMLGQLSDLTAKRTIGMIILVMLSFQLIRALRSEFLTHLPDSTPFRVGTGLTIGISTTLANAAGPIYSIYALVHKMEKNDFLGIGARFFLFLNIFKVPFLGQLNLINGESLRIDLILLPGIITGILLGRHLIKAVPQRAFETLLYLFSFTAGLRMLFS